MAAIFSCLAIRAEDYLLPHILSRLPDDVAIAPLYRLDMATQQEAI